jgi:hypothetical protein
MSLLRGEPFAAVKSMEEVLAIAYAMEQDAIDGYSKLADHMRRENRPDMVAVFERLVGEESQHLGNVVHWSEKVMGKKPDLANLQWEPADTFDDEGPARLRPNCSAPTAPSRWLCETRRGPSCSGAMWRCRRTRTCSARPPSRWRARSLANWPPFAGKDGEPFTPSTMRGRARPRSTFLSYKRGWRPFWKQRQPTPPERKRRVWRNSHGKRANDRPASRSDHWDVRHC